MKPGQQSSVPSRQTKQAPAPPQTNSMVSPQQAMQMLAQRIQALEQQFAMHMKEIERKLGDHAAYVSDNIPDIDNINTAIGEINSRILDVEEYEARITALESMNASPDMEAAPKPAPISKSSKKKGTVKLSE